MECLGVTAGPGPPLSCTQPHPLALRGLFSGGGFPLLLGQPRGRVKK